ncbi:MAG: hypothetical protein ACXAC6_10515 [Candidatus Hodarchaeales archaeon]|jgi:adenine/guanine phosphoribosyltransferase-like PRPP-binding protein
MTVENRYWDRLQLLFGLRLVLNGYRSSRALYKDILNHKSKNESLSITYSQFNRYLRGETEIPAKKADYIRSFILHEINITNDLILPSITMDIPENKKNPIQIDLGRLIRSVSSLNFLAYYLTLKEKLEGKFDSILTHPEAIPIAISFSQTLKIPWYSVEFRRPPGRTVSEYPYLIDQEHVSTVFFNQKEFGIQNKKVVIISDYIRKGGLLDILFSVVDENRGEVSFLTAIVGIGSIWKRFSTELDGQLKVCHIV